MRQTWQEHAENHEAFLRYLAAQGLTTQGEARKWRLRFWMAGAAGGGLALGILLRVVLGG